MINWKVLTPYLISFALLIMLLFRSNETVVVRVPSNSGSFNVIGPMPQSVEDPKEESVKAFEALPETKKTEAYKEAVSIRTYEKKFTDKVQTITATVKTVGTLEELNIDYKTHPVKKEVNVNKRASLFLGGGLSFPNGAPVYEVRAHLDLNKVLISVGYDPQNRAPSFGAAFKLF